MDYAAIIAQKDAKIAELERKNAFLIGELQQIKKLISGQKSERFVGLENANQLSLFGQPEQNNTPSESATQNIQYNRRAPVKHPGRNELPDHLPVEEIIILPQEDVSGMLQIGQEVTETLEYTAASLIKKRTIRPKYAKLDGQGVVIGKLPERSLPKAIAESSLLAHIIVSKFIDHIPFYRQINRFQRDFKWVVSDSTINEWFVAVCTLLNPLYEVLKRKVLESGYLQVDESPIKVLDRDHEKGIHQGYQWVYHSPLQKLVVFNYRKGRGQQGPKETLAAYVGIIQTDGWQVYDKFEEVPQITLVGCLAHARRKFFDAVQTNKAKSEQALSIIQDIYNAERKVKLQSEEQDKVNRQRALMPLFEKLRQWLDTELNSNVEPKSEYGKALTYLNKQWPKLIRIIQYDEVELDNNLIENKIRPLALGRKNYLFAGSHDAAQRIAMMYSFFGSCKAHDINPYEWLKNTLDFIPASKVTELYTLLPGYTSL